jgi:hypothetical protein
MGHPCPGELVKLLVDDGRQAIGRGGITRLGGLQQFRNVSDRLGRLGARHWQKKLAKLSHNSRL